MNILISKIYKGVEQSESSLYGYILPVKSRCPDEGFQGNVQPNLDSFVAVLSGTFP